MVFPAAMPRLYLPPFLALLLLLPLAAQAQTVSTVTASTVQEDRVDLTWPASWQADRTQSVYVYRTALSGPPDGTLGDLLTVASAESGAWSDRSGVPMQRYEYCLVRRAADDDEVARACVEGVRVIRAPRSLTATTTRSDGVALAWRNTSALEGRTLRVYRTGGTLQEFDLPLDGSRTPIADGLSASATSYVDATAEPGRSYVYAVTTVSDGVNSDPVYAAGLRATVPAPVDFAASDGTDPAAVRLSWTLAETFDVAAYRLFRESAPEPDGEGGGFGRVLITTVAVEPGQAVAGRAFAYVDASAEGESRYRYCAVAVTSGGAASQEVCDVGSRTGLQPPTAVAATDNAFDDRVDVTWTYGGSDANGFAVSRACVLGRGGAACAAGTETAVDIGSVGALVRRYEDRTAVQGVTYRYQVAATTTQGARSAIGADQQDQGTRAYVLAPTTVVAATAISRTASPCRGRPRRRRRSCSPSRAPEP